MIDQNNDTTFSNLRQLIAEYPSIRPHIKTASVGEEVRSSLPDSAFADKLNRRFPVASKADAILSKAYATKVANLAEDVMSQIDTALDMFGVDRDMFTSQKVAHVQAEPKYLIKSKSKFAINDATTIKEAEEAIYRNKTKLSPESLSEASINLIKEASARNKNVSTETLKYAGLVQCNSYEARNWLEARAHKSKNKKVAAAFNKLAHVVDNLDSTVGRDDLIKLSSAVKKLDQMEGFNRYYGIKMPDPVETVFNTKVAMQPKLVLGDKEVPVERLLAVDPMSYGDILGTDIVEEITENGELVPDKLIEILETLPADMKTTLVKELNL